jgi:hypothetical protein
MRSALFAGLAAMLLSIAAPAQEAEEGGPPLYAVAEIEGPTVQEVIDGYFALDFDVPGAMTSAVGADLQLDQISGALVWQFAGPFETIEQVEAALPWEEWLAANAGRREDQLVRWMGYSVIRERFLAELSIATGVPDPSRPLNQQAILILWRVELAEGEEERAHELLARRLVPAMAARRREVVLFRARDAEWDALLLEGPFATGGEADPEGGGGFERALLDPVEGRRERRELASLIARVDRQIVYRWITGEQVPETALARAPQ